MTDFKNKEWWFKRKIVEGHQFAKTGRKYSWRANEKKTLLY
jgi:hypothetical protein